MTSLITQPQLITSAAADASQISSAISAARAAAAAPTTSLAAAAEDEVSAAAAALFGGFGQEYQALLQQAAAFHDQFVATLAAAGNTYSQAEAAAAGTLGAMAGASPGVGASATPAAQIPVVASLILTGSGTANPPLSFVQDVTSRYLTNFMSALTVPVTTAEGLYPFTGTKDLTLDISLARGVISLDNAINLQIHPGNGSAISVLGYSQSAIIASMEMPKLVAEGFNSSQVNFTLLGDPSNPNGGLLSRFPGLSFPSLGATFGNATPSNDFPTTIFTLEYDGFADFPQYPIDLLSDVNALLGIVFVHGTYPTLTATQLASAFPLMQSGAPTMTTYNLIPTPNLPLLDPLRIIPVIGNPLADLVQPDLTYLINWGYGNPLFGYSTGPADVVTPFGFLPPLSATTSLPPLLISGAQQGVAAFVGDLSAEVPTSLPAMSLPGITGALTGGSSGLNTLALPTATSIPSTVTGILSGLESANNNIVGGLTTDFSTAYATLLPTADIATALTVTLPSYDFDLFINGITQAVNGDPVGLVNAFGNPIAANVGLTTLAGGFELISIDNSLETILTGTPNPGPQ
ncbi:MAG: PE-PPE domain-containing protein [Mycobacterium sp.]